MGKKTKKEILEILKKEAKIFVDTTIRDTAENVMNNDVSRNIFDNLLQDIFHNMSKESQIAFYKKYADVIKQYPDLTKKLKEDAESVTYAASKIDSKDIEEFEESIEDLNPFNYYLKTLEYVYSNEKYESIRNRFSIASRITITVKPIKEINDSLIDFLVDMDLPEEVFNNVRYTNCFRQDPSEYPKIVDKEVKELIEAENKKDNPDKDYIKLLEDSNNLLDNLDKESALLSNVLEHTGTAKSHEMERLLQDFLKEKNVESILISNSYIKSTKQLNEFYKNNKPCEYTVNEEFNDLLLKEIGYLREHEMTDGTLSQVIRPHSTKLIEAIQNKNKEEIVNAYKVFKDKINTIDTIIKEQKANDPTHQFNSNFGSARENYYPGHYRTDYEGTTLFNQVAYINTFCQTKNIEPKDFLVNPMEYINDHVNSYDEQAREMYKNLLTGNDIFAMVKKVQQSSRVDFELFKQECSQSIVQMPPCLALNDTKNRVANQSYLQFELFSSLESQSHNVAELLNSLHGDIFKEKVLPAKILLGDNYDPLTMYEGKTGLLDIKTKELQHFNMKEYLLEEYDVNELLDRVTNFATEVVERNDNNTLGKNATLYDDAVKNAAKIIKDTYLENVDEKDACSTYVDYCCGIQQLTDIKANTVKAKFDIEMNNLKKVTSENLNEKFELLADLNKKYYSHNGLKRIFSSSLREQKRLIESMKQSFIDSGVNKKDLDNALKSYQKDTEQEKENVSNFITSNYIKLNEKEIFDESVEKLDLSNELAENVQEKNPVVEESFEPEIVQEKIK